ncbi:hypothetical protein ACLKA7_005163 [Drosophila subpalustris]
MNSVQSATEQQEHIGSFKRRLRKRRDADADAAAATTTTTTTRDLVLLQKVYKKQFYFEKRVGSGGGKGIQKQKQKLPGAWWLLVLVNSSASFG